MPQLGPLEILVIFVVALLVFGPQKLPEIGRQVGKGIREFRRVQEHLRSELDDVLGHDDESPVADAPTPTLSAGDRHDPSVPAGPHPSSRTPPAPPSGSASAPSEDPVPPADASS
jgi:sec-independent protein translocase protein TatA